MNSDVPIGYITAFNGSEVPEGWADVTEIFAARLQYSLSPEVMDVYHNAPHLKYIVRVGDLDVSEVMKDYNIKERLLSFEF